MPDRYVRPLAVTTGRHPFEVAFFASAVAVGVFLVVLNARPESVRAAMPPLVQGMWVAGLLVGGAVGLLAAVVQGFSLWRGLLTELVAAAVCGAALGIYAVAIFAVSAVQGVAGGTFVAAFAVASWWRFWQIVVDIRRLGRAVRQGRIARIPLLAEGNGLGDKS
jgi:hypothetical protein